MMNKRKRRTKMIKVQLQMLTVKILREKTWRLFRKYKRRSSKSRK